MAKIKVSTTLIEELLFGYSTAQVTVRGATFDPTRNVVEFDVVGADVPDVAEVRGEFTQQTNRRGERFHTLEFKAA